MKPKEVEPITHTTSKYLGPCKAVGCGFRLLTEADRVGESSVVCPRCGANQEVSPEFRAAQA